LRKRPRTPAKGRGSVQRAIKRAFAAVYRDHGISGAKGRDKRSAFDKLCRDAARREFDMVMVVGQIPMRY
jgi:DNA invertase Pin-like site-specific DNA recombinase